MMQSTRGTSASLSRRIYTLMAFTASPGQESAVVDLWTEMASSSMERVPGALMGEILQDPADPRRLFALGVWVDQQSLELWRRLPEYRRFFERLLPLCEEVERRNLTVLARAVKDGER